MLAYAPLFPHPKEEKWNFIVADTANNTVYNRQEISLIEAEAVGISHPVSSFTFEPYFKAWERGSQQLCKGHGAAQRRVVSFKPLKSLQVICLACTAASVIPSRAIAVWSGACLTSCLEAGAANVQA